MSECKIQSRIEWRWLRKKEYELNGDQQNVFWNLDYFLATDTSKNMTLETWLFSY